MASVKIMLCFIVLCILLQLVASQPWGGHGFGGGYGRWGGGYGGIGVIGFGRRFGYGYGGGFYPPPPPPFFYPPPPFYG